jgi:hypothetical protein
VKSFVLLRGHDFASVVESGGEWWLERGGEWWSMVERGAERWSVIAETICVITKTTCVLLFSDGFDT